MRRVSILCECKELVDVDVNEKRIVRHFLKNGEPCNASGQRYVPSPRGHRASSRDCVLTESCGGSSDIVAVRPVVNQEHGFVGVAALVRHEHGHGHQQGHEHGHDLPVGSTSAYGAN